MLNVVSSEFLFETQEFRLAGDGENDRVGSGRNTSGALSCGMTELGEFNSQRKIVSKDAVVREGCVNESLSWP